jgi:FkbM family methyltransferase
MDEHHLHSMWPPPILPCVAAGCTFADRAAILLDYLIGKISAPIGDAFAKRGKPLPYVMRIPYRFRTSWGTFRCPGGIMAFMASPFWEPEVAAEIGSLSDGTFVDVGAAIGIHTIRAARILGCKGHVIALEPSPLRFQYLQRNIINNNISNVTAMNVAAGASDQMGARFSELICGTWDRDIFQVEYSKMSRRWPSFTADVFRLDRLLAKERVRLIKLDVEGWELACLMGAADVLIRDRPTVVFEALTVEDAARCTNFLRAHGYVVFGKVPGNLVAKWA